MRLIAADMDIITANNVLSDKKAYQPYTRLKKALEPVTGDYDYCIIDNAPDIALNTINALVASDYVMIPAKLDKFMLEGLAILIDDIQKVKAHWNSGLELLGTFITMKHNERRRDNEAYHKEAIADLWRVTGVEPFKAAIGRTGKVDESTYTGAPILEYSRGCTASFGYLNLTAEMLDRIAGLML
jgi:chromosome partitioning protein